MLPLLMFCLMFCGTGLIMVYMLGYFRKIEFVEKEFPGMHVIYAQHRGDYRML